MDSTINKKAELCEELPNDLIADDYDEINGDYYSNSTISLYLKEINRYPLLTPIEEQELAKQIANGDELARDKFINSNLRLVVSIAEEYHTKKFQLLDLIQEGNLGLIKAVEMFDYTKGFKFSSYATSCIRGTILSALTDKGELIRIPAEIKKLIKEYQSIQNDFYKENRRYATDTEVSKEMQLPIYMVKQIKSYIYNTISLNMPISFEDDTELGDFIEDAQATPEEILIRNSNTKLLNLLISNSDLTEIEERIIRMRYDLESHEINSLGTIARKTGKTKKKVKMIEAKALRKLKITATIKIGKDFFI